MQYLDINEPKQWQILQLTKYSLLVLACMLLWFLPSTHLMCSILDAEAFKFLNGSLQYSRVWQTLWGYLNHPAETWLNVIAMFAINALGIYSLPAFRRRKAIAAVVYFWIFFQVVLLVTHKIFADWLAVQRQSPSMLMVPQVILSEALNIENLKVYSNNCFPAGHALVAVFWAKFSLQYSRSWVQPLIILTVFALIMPRLFSGAHWLSDIIFTVCYALFWYAVATGTPLFNFITAQILKLFNFVKPFPKVAGST